MSKIDNPSAGGGGGASPSNSVVTEEAFGQGDTPGVSGLYSRGDHTHGTPADPHPLSTGDPHAQYQLESEKGAANGYAPLDASSDVPDANIPAGIERTANKDAASGYAGLDANGRVVSSKIQVSATGKVVGRQTAGAGAAEELSPAHSVILDGTGLRLSGDAASPGNNQVYGTDGSGVKGWKADPGGGGADPYLPTTAQIIVDDFLSGWMTETGEAGHILPSFANGSLLGVAAVVQNHPGIIVRRSGTTAAQVATWFGLGTVAAQSFRFDEWAEMTYIVRLVSTAADFAVRFGVTADPSSVTPAHSVHIERLAADTSFFGVSRNGGTETRTAALVAHDTNFHKFRIRRISSTQVGFTVDGGSEVTITSSNIPDAADGLKPHLQVVPTTTTARDIEADFISLKMLAITR